MKTTTLSLETAKLMYQSSDLAIKQFALDNYPELGIKSLPKTWEELKEISGYYIDAEDDSVNSIQEVKTSSSTQSVFETREQAEASIALAQLSQLKKVYNGDWEADWSKIANKFCLEYSSGKIEKRVYSATQQFLTFKTSELREEFLKNFRDLIEQAKPLL